MRYHAIKALTALKSERCFQLLLCQVIKMTLAINKWHHLSFALGCKLGNV